MIITVTVTVTAASQQWIHPYSQYTPLPNPPQNKQLHVIEAYVKQPWWQDKNHLKAQGIHVGHKHLQSDDMLEKHSRPIRRSLQKIYDILASLLLGRQTLYDHVVNAPDSIITQEIQTNLMQNDQVRNPTTKIKTNKQTIFLVGARMAWLVLGVEITSNLQQDTRWWHPILCHKGRQNTQNKNKKWKQSKELTEK